MKKILIFALLATSLGAQTANVIELKPDDALKVKTAWQELQKAEARWKDVNDLIDFSYVEVPYENALISGRSYHPREGFQNGFEFSNDFKYIVPKSSQITTNNIINRWGGVCLSGSAPMVFVECH